MMRRLVLDIAPDLTLTIGSQSARVTPHLGLRLAESLMRVSTRELIREEAEASRAKMVRVPVQRTAKRK
jgi:hypothetical protein